VDVKTTFLNGNLEEEIYINIPEGHRPEGISDDEWHQETKTKVLKLKKSLYGPKQAPKCWNKKIDESLQRFGLKRLNSDQAVYVRADSSLEGQKELYLALYVDDMLIAGGDIKEIEYLKTYLGYEFTMTDLGEVRTILGINISRDRQLGIMKLDQRKYVEEILKKFSMTNCKGIGTPLDPSTKLSKEFSPTNLEDKLLTS